MFFHRRKTTQRRPRLYCMARQIGQRQNRIYIQPQQRPTMFVAWWDAFGISFEKYLVNTDRRLNCGINACEFMVLRSFAHPLVTLKVNALRWRSLFLRCLKPDSQSYMPLNSEIWQTSIYLLFVRWWADKAKLLIPISLPELVQSVLELVHRRSFHNILR